MGGRKVGSERSMKERRERRKEGETEIERKEDGSRDEMREG